MLSEDHVSDCIEALVRLGIVESVPGDNREGGLLRMIAPPDRILSRIVSEGQEGPPEGVELVPWFSISLVKAVLEEKNIAVSRDELAGMAAVVMVFIRDGDAMRGLHSGYSRQVISQKREKRIWK